MNASDMVRAALSAKTARLVELERINREQAALLLEEGAP